MGRLILLLFISAFLFTWITQTKSQCRGKCGASYNRTASCQCDYQCSEFDNCCYDYQEECITVQCAGKCGTPYDDQAPCQCNDQCTQFKNCCPDYFEECIATTAEPCAGNCDSLFNSSASCQCNRDCVIHGNCCGDYISTCIKFSQCAKRCGAPYDSKETCQCDDNCELSHNCCQDYNRQCTECARRCGAEYNGKAPCQCDDACSDRKDCCQDYIRSCTSHADKCAGNCRTDFNPLSSCQCHNACIASNTCCDDYKSFCINSRTKRDAIDDHDHCSTLSDIGSALWDADVDRVPDTAYTLDYNDADNDHRLFSHLDESKISTPLYASFHALLDNYSPLPEVEETKTAVERDEENAFLDVVLGTKVMKILGSYLQCRGKVKDQDDFRQTIQDLWFTFYSWSKPNTTLDTSAFEHVFVGKYMNSNIVDGFHSWLQLYCEEKAGRLLFERVVQRFEPNIIKVKFSWNGNFLKSAPNAMFVGVSPAFDLAVYSLCALERSNAECDLTLDGHQVKLRTHEIPGHFAAAYIVSSN